jgi:polysaccharide biosynthesis/export protein
MKVFFILFFFSLMSLFAQSSNQIQQVKEVAQQMGLNKDAVISRAKLAGYSNTQIEDAMIKEEALSPSSNDLENISNVKTELAEDNTNEKIEESKIDESKDDRLTNISELPFFGYEIFDRDPALFQASSFGAVDPNYSIGPGDEIIVMLWGETQFRQVLSVDPEGFVFIPEVGQVFVNGLSLNLLEAKLFRVLSQSYASLSPENRDATTFLDVSIGNLRPLRIQVLGEVSQPGSYTVSPSATLFSSLYYFNGPTTRGSLRDIQLIRGGEKIASIDFYDYLLTGRKPNDQKLQLDDVIFIPRRLKTVAIEGEINKSGIYELKPKEDLNHLIEVAGGLKITAYLKRAQIDRVVSFDMRDVLEMDRVLIDLNLGESLENAKKFEIQDGDHLSVFSIMDTRQNIVFLEGAVNRPGQYDIGDSLRISTLLVKADGFLGDVYKRRVDLVRLKSDFNEELIKLNLSKILLGDTEHDILLKNQDKVRLYGMSEMISNKFVNIEGHVKSPGQYSLQENMNIYDLIFKAGGFLDKEFLDLTYLRNASLFRLNKDQITRSHIKINLGQILRSPESKINVALQPGDMLKIYKKDIFISVKPIIIDGAIRFPAQYSFKENMTLNDIIIEAGGLIENIYEFKVEIARIDTKNKNLNKFADTLSFNMDHNYALFNVENRKLNKNINKSSDFKLMPYDHISIRRDPFFKIQKTVNISGEVLYPGKYVILNSEEKITDIIRRAGGLLKNSFPEGSLFKRNGNQIRVSFKEILKSENSKLNIIVQNGDEIEINTHPNSVVLIGEVNRPGNHVYVPNKRMDYYIEKAGWLTPEADKKNIWVDYINGESKYYRKWSIISPKIIDGSIINIGKKKEEEPFDLTTFMTDATTILANVTQALAIFILSQ